MTDIRAALAAYADEHENTDRLTHIHRADAAPRAFEALRKVLELHGSHVTPEGVECCNAEGEMWPCPTVRAISTALGRDAYDREPVMTYSPVDLDANAADVDAMFPGLRGRVMDALAGGGTDAE